MTPELKAKLATIAAEKRKRFPKPADYTETDLLVACDYVADQLGQAELAEIPDRAGMRVYLRYVPKWWDDVLGQRIPHERWNCPAGPGKWVVRNVYRAYFLAPIFTLLRLDAGQQNGPRRCLTTEGVQSGYWMWLHPKATRVVEVVHMEECQFCLGYGHFNEDGEPTIDKRCRKCLDCTGTGMVPDKAEGVN